MLQEPYMRRLGLTDLPAELERRLIAAVGNPQEHAQVRQEIRQAGLPHLADELDRIAEHDA